MAMNLRELTPALRARFRYAIAAVIGGTVVDVFDGAVFPAEAVEHGVEAAFWAVAVAGYGVLARLRPLPAENRIADAAIVSGMALIGAESLLRATLPDAIAFRADMLLLMTYVLCAVLLLRRRSLAQRQPMP